MHFVQLLFASLLFVGSATGYKEYHQMSDQEKHDAGVATIVIICVCVAIAISISAAAGFFYMMRKRKH